MAFNLGTAILWLKGDDSELQKTLAGAESKAQGFSGRVGGFLSNAFSVVAGGLITRGIDAVTGSIGGLISGMVGGNAEFEGYNTRFKVMLGSAEAAKQRMDDLAKFGASTPFELPEVVKASTILQGFGLYSDEAKKKFGMAGEDIMRVAGDVASGTGSSFEEMSLLLGKFSSGATGEAISRMQELGITSRDQLTQMGLKFSASGQLLSPLPESMAVVLKLMKEKYGGLMDAQSATFDGMMSNLADWKDGVLRQLGAPIFEVLKEKLAGLLQFLGSDEVKATISGFADALAGGIGVAMDWLANTVFPAVSSGAAEIGRVISLLALYWQEASHETSSFGEALGYFLDTLIGTGEGITGPFQTAAQVLPGIIGGIVGFVASLTGSFSNETSAWSQIFGAASALIAGVMSGIQAIIAAVLPIISTFWQKHGAEIVAFAKAAWEQIGQIVLLVINILKATIVPALEYIAGFISSHSALIQSTLGLAWTAASNVIQAALTLIKGILTAALQAINGDWKGAWETVKSTLSAVWENLKTAIGAALEVVKNNIQGFVGFVLGIFDINLARSGEAIVQSLWDGLKAKWAELAQWFEDKLAGLRNKLPFSEPKDRSSPLYGLAKSGKAMVEMIQRGISDSNPLQMVPLTTINEFEDADAASGGKLTKNLQKNFDILDRYADLQGVLPNSSIQDNRTIRVHLEAPAGADRGQISELEALINQILHEQGRTADANNRIAPRPRSN